MKIDIGQLEFIDIKLRRILLWLEYETGLEFTVTSLYRMDDPGVHGVLPLRGTDLRMRCEDLGHKIVTLINQKWTYDPNRPTFCCAILHGEGANMHIHLQVHPNTIGV